MGVAREGEPEMAERIGGVARLHLRSEHLLHDLGAGVMLADPIEDPVEGRWLDHLAEREFEVVGFEVILERDQFLAARRFVDPVHHGRLARFERLGRGDVGGDHVILDQLVRVQALARGDRHDPPLFVEHHLALGQVEFERFAPFPSGEQRAPAIPQRPERGFDQFGGNRTGDGGHIAV